MLHGFPGHHEKLCAVHSLRSGGGRRRGLTFALRIAVSVAMFHFPEDGVSEAVAGFVVEKVVHAVKSYVW